MAEVCTHNKYDEQPDLNADYKAAIEYRKSGQRTWFTGAVQAVVELRSIGDSPERLLAIREGVICGAGACAAHSVQVVETPVNDGSVDNYRPPTPRENEETTLTVRAQ
ncbi:MAG: hypothetical protein JWO41_203 [Candidatus Saccharibacteria bacterium]|nr:hypothetical protein [Candidatus Saccharibacteria bacterium]